VAACQPIYFMVELALSSLFELCSTIDRYGTRRFGEQTCLSTHDDLSIGGVAHVVDALARAGLFNGFDSCGSLFRLNRRHGHDRGAIHPGAGHVSGRCRVRERFRLHWASTRYVGGSISGLAFSSAFAVVQ
jgi:hypothetical protein